MKLKVSNVHRSLPTYHQDDLNLWFFNQLLQCGNLSVNIILDAQSTHIPDHIFPDEWAKLILPKQSVVKDHFFLQSDTMILLARVRNNRNLFHLKDSFVKSRIILGTNLIRAEMTVQNIRIIKESKYNRPAWSPGSFMQFAA
jgi:hypothetical protein